MYFNQKSLDIKSNDKYLFHQPNTSMSVYLITFKSFQLIQIIFFRSLNHSNIDKYSNEASCIYDLNEKIKYFTAGDREFTLMNSFKIITAYSKRLLSDTSAMVR